MACSKLEFTFDESPKWRDESPGMTTSKMLEQITKWRLEYKRLPQDAKDFCVQQFARAMAVDYIHNLNVGERVGTQSLEDTKEVLEKFFDDSVSHSDGEDCRKARKETMNTYKAMKQFHEEHENMENTGLLTVDMICHVHKILLDGLHPDCGNIRKTKVYTTWYGGPHFYPDPLQAEDLLYALVDHHNIYMEASKTLDETSNEYTVHIFKCASRLLFDFVNNTHPFADGNGRMCRLLANYVVGLITPFPVSLYHTQDKTRSGRDDYLEAIVRCRENPEEGPRGLAAMLVEGAWRGWDSLFKNLKRNQQLEPGVVIGPIVVKKSTCDKDDVSKQVGRILSRRELEAEQDRAVDLVLGTTRETDVSTLSPNQYMEANVCVAGGFNLKLNIYGP